MRNYNNSMYTTIPPRTFIEPQQDSPQDLLMEEIEAHIDEQEYTDHQIRLDMWLENKIFEELIKNEPKCIY